MLFSCSIEIIGRITEWECWNFLKRPTIPSVQYMPRRVRWSSSKNLGLLFLCSHLRLISWDYNDVHSFVWIYLKAIERPVWLLLVVVVVFKKPLFLFLCFAICYFSGHFWGDARQRPLRWWCHVLEVFWRYWCQSDLSHQLRRVQDPLELIQFEGKKSCVNLNCSVLFAPLFVFVVDVFYFLVCCMQEFEGDVLRNPLLPGVIASLLDRFVVWKCFFKAKFAVLCMVQEFLQLRGSVTAYAYNLQSQDRFFFCFKAKLGGHPWKMCRSPWPKYLEMTRMSLRAALNSWTTGEVAILMAIAAFRRLEFYLGGY